MPSQRMLTVKGWGSVTMTSGPRAGRPRSGRVYGAKAATSPVQCM